MNLWQPNGCQRSCHLAGERGTLMKRFGRVIVSASTLLVPGDGLVPFVAVVALVVTFVVLVLALFR